MYSSSKNTRVEGARRWLANHRRGLAHAHRQAVWRLARVNVALNKACPCSKAIHAEEVRKALRELERQDNKKRRLDDEGVVMLDLKEDIQLTQTCRKCRIAAAREHAAGDRGQGEHAVGDRVQGPVHGSGCISCSTWRGRSCSTWCGAGCTTWLSIKIQIQCHWPSSTSKAADPPKVGARVRKRLRSQAYAEAKRSWSCGRSQAHAASVAAHDESGCISPRL